ncbi:MAG TPA: cobyric acid synthase [Stellaceae bacterium]|nr:cobyric acid synthase [Stellaceae bacterium]
MTRALMLQGAGSDVGKSLLVAGLARAFSRRGLRVAPFKPQNMSNNAAVTPDGGEIGRAQALQARAAFRKPARDMNPVLLKPQSDGTAQLVLHGRVAGSHAAREYHRLAPTLLPAVLAAFGRLAAGCDLVLVEGAGSPAEINLRAGDIANMGFALAADVPVVLVGDIERGGVIAQLVGTHALLTGSERALVAGCIVNKFLGDPALFDSGVRAIGERTGWRCFGVVPYFPEAARLPAEDSMALRRSSVPDGDCFASLAMTVKSVIARSGATKQSRSARIRIAVPVLPRIANFDDLDPLAAEPAVELVMVPRRRPLPRDAALVILPGSKATLADLAVLRQEGWEIDILAHRRQGGHVLGLCGGFQMLGRRIADPEGIEGPAGAASGLGLLDIETVLGNGKRLAEGSGVDIVSGESVRGYEMHLGVTTGPGLARPMLRLGDRPDGAVSEDGRVAGCYLHGLFTGDAFRAAFLERLGAAPSGFAYEAAIEATLDRLAAHLEQSLDLDALLAASRSPRLTEAA